MELFKKNFMLHKTFQQCNSFKSIEYIFVCFIPLKKIVILYAKSVQQIKNAKKKKEKKKIPQHEIKQGKTEVYNPLLKM